MSDSQHCHDHDDHHHHHHGYVDSHTGTSL